MKRYFLLLLLIWFSSCISENLEEVIPFNASKISGDWEVISETYSIGGPEIITPIDNGGIYSFRQNSIFTFQYEDDTSLNFSGTYNFKEDLLALSYFLDEIKIERNLKVIFEDNQVVFIPWEPTCIEGCSTRLQKIIYLED